MVSLGAGWRVTLAGDDVPNATGRTFVCLKATHRFRAQAYGSGSAGADDAPYEGAYVLTPDDAPFRPERRTAGPRVQGPETAVVVGEGEIDCDEHGRILCRFHWDLDGAHTMRVRVSQNWASQGWGGMVIPRIGMEVIVEHLRGDPDKPIVTGCVYNGRSKPPYELPKHKTRSTFRTDTHKGRGFNELRFEDESGREEIFVHAERDMNVGVENNATRSVGANSHTQIGRNATALVTGMQAEFSGLGRMLASGGSISIESGRASTVSAMAGSFFRSGGTVNYPFETILRDSEVHRSVRPGSFSVNASAEISMQGGGEMTIGTSEGITVSAQETVSVFSGDDYRLTSGQTITQYAGGNMLMASDGAMILRAGDAEIILRPNGDIDLNGAKITLKGDTIWLN